MLSISQTREGLSLQVLVQPRSSRNQIVGEFEGALKIKLTAPPVEGEANQALLAFLAQRLKLAKNQLRLTRGESSRHKIVEIKGIGKEQLLSRLGLQ